MNQIAVAPGDDEADEGRLQFPVGQVIGADVAPNVVHSHKGFMIGESQPSRRRKPHEKGADKPRAPCGADEIHILHGNSRFFQGQIQHGQNSGDVLARCDLRHHAAEEPVYFDL